MGSNVAPPWFDLTLHWISVAIEGAGVAVIVLGAVLAVGLSAFRAAKEGWSSELFHELRTWLARAILLGLEFLVAADIIGTVAVEPTLRNLGILAIIVLIRTFLSFSLEVEIQGRWPWQRAGDGSG